MKFDVQIKNLGKIQEANIKVRPLTLVAGVNSSGKSFFTKSFYSILKTISRRNDLAFDLRANLKQLTEVQRYIKYELPRLSKIEGEDLKYISEYIAFLEKAIDDLPKLDNFEEKIKAINNDSNLIDLSNKLNRLIINFITILKDKPTKYQRVEKYIGTSEHYIKTILSIIEKPREYYFSLLSSITHRYMQNNFQVRKISELISKATENTQIRIKDVISLNFSESKFFYRTENSSKLQNFEELSNIVFFESPIFWRLKNIFERLNENDLSPYYRDRFLTGIPEYFYDIAGLLKLTPRSDVEFPDLLAKIAKAINGQIIISPTGSLAYKDDKYEYSLNTTALGISNLGMIGLLIEKNIVTKGSFLIIDEPETNLHPEWQMVLMEVLFELSKRGVNIVFATHSLDMVKCLEVIIQKAISQKEDLTDHIGINLLNGEGKSEELESDLLQQICEVKQILAEPYALKSMESLKYD